jgi:hypothetical protein
MPDPACYLEAKEGALKDMAEAEPTQVDDFVREAAALAARDWAEIDKFLDTFDQILARAASDGFRNVAADVLRALATEHGKDLIARLGELGRWAQEGGQGALRCWAFYQAFCEALPESSFDPEALADALEAADPANDISLKGLAQRSWETADLLFGTFIARPDSSVALLAADALAGLAHFDLPEAHLRALNLTRAESRILRRVGIGMLGSFHYPKTAEDLLRLTLERLEALKAKPDPETDDVLTKAYGRLIGRAEAASGAFIEIAERHDQTVQSAVTSILYQRAVSDREQVWYSEALRTLARVPTRLQKMNILDHCVACGAQSRPEFATEFLEAFVKGRDYGNEGEGAKLTDLLKQTFLALRREAFDALEGAITHWFASSDKRLHQAASDLVMHGHYGSRDSKLAPLKLSKRILDSLDEQMLSLVLYRILGYVIGGRPLAALIASALQREPLTPSLGGLVEEALAEHVLYNYPGSGGEYLTAYLESDEIAEAIREILQRALARSEAYLSALGSLPRLNELRPPTHRMARLRLAEQKFHGAIMEEARKRSVLMSLMHHTTLKFGASSFTEMEGVFTEPTALGTISHSVELPRGELIDPVGQQLLRLQWRTIGLQEEKEEV